MGTPTVYKDQSDVGRYGEATLTVAWTTEDSDDLDSEVLVDKSALTKGLLNSKLGVRSIEWSKTETVEADVYYDSLPASAKTTVVALGGSASESEVDFSDGVTTTARKDPNAVGGDLVVTTTGALPGDKLWIRVLFKVYGTTE